MARLGELLTVAILICSLHEAVSDSSSHSALYQKLRTLFEDKRVLQVADEVRRDLKDERSGHDSGEELLSQLSRLLTDSDNKEQRDEKEQEEAYERQRQEEQREVDDGTPLKRLLMILRKWDIKTQPWFSLKPAKSGYDKECYIMKKPGYYETIWPKECKYFIEKDTNWTRHCKKFCKDWTAAIKKANNGECEYDNKNTEEHCEERIGNSCSDCEYKIGSLYSSCCGTCSRKCP